MKIAKIRAIKELTTESLSHKHILLHLGITCDLSDLTDVKPVRLLVICSDRPDLGRAIGSFLGRMEDLPEMPGIVLDIDLDYFSTQNPFLDLHREAGLYDRLKRVRNDG